MRIGIVMFVIASLSGCLGFAQDGPVVGDAPQDVETRFVSEPADLRVEPWIEGLYASERDSDDRILRITPR